MEFTFQIIRFIYQRMGAIRILQVINGDMRKRLGTTAFDEPKQASRKQWARHLRKAHKSTTSSWHQTAHTENTQSKFQADFSHEQILGKSYTAPLACKVIKPGFFKGVLSVLGTQKAF